MAAEAIGFAVAVAPLAVFIHLVGGDHHHRAGVIQAAQGFEHIQRPHHIGGPGAEGIEVAAAHQGLGRKMQHHLGIGCRHKRSQGVGVTDVDAAVLQLASQIQGSQIEGIEEAGAGVGGEGHAGDAGTKLEQPQRQPAALEAGVAGEQHAPAGPEGRVRAATRAGHQLQSFQGAWPLSQRSSRRLRSRRVSIDCQKPWWR